MGNISISGLRVKAGGNLDHGNVLSILSVRAMAPALLIKGAGSEQPWTELIELRYHFQSPRLVRLMLCSYRMLSPRLVQA